MNLSIVRKLEPVQLISGEEKGIWVYWYHFPVKPEPEIDSGDYLEYVKHNKTA